MDIHQDIIKWLRTMGYNGEMPESLISICNNSTKFIWEELIQNVRPKEEVELIKGNIILNRLKSKPLSRQDDFAFRIQEIENFRQKLALEEKLKSMKNMVQEKKYKVETLSQTCKIKDVSIDFLKKKIKENEERKYLLDLKNKQLQKQNSEAKETLTSLKNVTPVEREESNTAKQITETLEKCAEKLTKILNENQKSVSQNLQKNTMYYQTNRTKKNHDHSSVATYLSMREKEDFEEISRSCVKKPKDKENIPSNMQINRGKLESKKRLFDVPQIVVEDTEKQSFELLSSSINSRNHQDDVFFEENNQIDVSFRKPKKRESLGMLPESCFNDKDNDSFLQCSGSISPVKEIGNDSHISSNHVFPFMSTNPQKGNNSSDSVVFNFNRKKPEKDYNKTKIGKTEEYYKKQLYCDSFVNKELENLLHGNNRELIYETLQKLFQSLKVESTKIVSMEGSMDGRKNKVNEDDLTKLQLVHVQTELKIVQQKKILKDLVAKIGRRKLQVLSSIKSKEDLVQLQDWLDTNIKQVGLDASLAAMKKEINSSKTIENDDNELQVLSSRILKVKNDITNKIKLIQTTIEDLYKTQKFLTATRESVQSPIWHIRMFKTDTEWMNPLLENLWSEELQVFEDFPLEYQRRCTYTDPKTYYRDLCTDNYPEDTTMELEDFQMLCEILESPFNPPETILLNVLKAKMKMEVLKKIRNNTTSIGEQYDKKYSYEELVKQESYLEFSIDQLKAIMISSNANKTLAIGDVTNQTMEIWKEMPMKDFISNKRLVEGHNYQFYQNKLNSVL